MEEFRLVRFNGGNLQHRKGTGTSEDCKNLKKSNSVNEKNGYDNNYVKLHPELKTGMRGMAIVQFLRN